MMSKIKVLITDKDLLTSAMIADLLKDSIELIDNVPEPENPFGFDPSTIHTYDKTIQHREDPARPYFRKFEKGKYHNK